MRTEAGLRRIGFVGVGNMGLPMAVRVRDAGFEVTVHDISAAGVAAAAADGLAAASSLAGLAAGMDAIVTSLPNGSVLAAVVGTDRMAADSLLRGRPGGLFVIDTSSCSPVDSRPIGEILARSGGVLLDAPVSGGVARARSGDLSVMVGGEPAAVERAMPVLRAVGSSIVRTGAPGTGHTMKALNNFITATTLTATIEALLIGAAAGLEPGAMLEVVNNSTSRSQASEVKLGRFVLSRAFDDGFAISLMAKDLRNAQQVAAGARVGAVLLAPTVRAWQAAAAELPRDASHTAVTLWLEKVIGCVLR
jgi:3-hydroxyisobutyrate dehydrogenase